MVQRGRSMGRGAVGAHGAHLGPPTGVASRRVPVDVRSSADARASVPSCTPSALVGSRLDGLLGDPSVSEVMLNGPGEVWVERHGAVVRSGVVVDRATLDALVERTVAAAGRRVDRSSPIVDVRLADGSRVNVVLAPLAPDGPCVTIRRFRTRSVALGEFGPSDVVGCITSLVEARANVVVSGGTGAGKTTFLNALAAAIDPRERVVTVEDTAELALPLPHVVRLEARPANADGRGGVTLRDLVRTVLRMRPDRIVVGECRGGEALDLVQAMHTGHRGTLGTLHANDPADALRRLETLVLLAGTGLAVEAVRVQIRSALDAVVHVARGSDGSRRIDAVALVERNERDGVRHVVRDGQLLVGADPPLCRQGVGHEARRAR